MKLTRKAAGMHTMLAAIQKSGPEISSAFGLEPAGDGTLASTNPSAVRTVSPLDLTVQRKVAGRTRSM